MVEAYNTLVTSSVPGTDPEGVIGKFVAALAALVDAKMCIFVAWPRMVVSFDSQVAKVVTFETVCAKIATPLVWNRKKNIKKKKNIFMIISDRTEHDIRSALPNNSPLHSCIVLYRQDKLTTFRGLLFILYLMNCLIGILPTTNSFSVVTAIVYAG